MLINEARFADMQSTSYLPYAAAPVGEVVWPTDSPIDLSGGWVDAMSIANDQLIIRHTAGIEARQRNNGSLLWKNTDDPGARHLLLEEGVLGRDPAGFLSLVDYQGKTSRGPMLLFLDEYATLLWMRRVGEEIRYIYQVRSFFPHDPQATPVEAHTVYARVGATTEELLGMVEAQGAHVNACLSKDEATVCLATAKMLLIAPTDVDLKYKPILLNFERLHALSINHQQQIVLVDEREGEQWLRCLGLNGDEIWATKLPVFGQVNQPPVSAPAGRIWLTIDNKVLHFYESTLAWTYEAPTGKPVLITATAQNTILAVSDTVFTHLSEQGKPILNRVFGAPLTCRPLLDERGHIYLGGKGYVLCLR